MGLCHRKLRAGDIGLQLLPQEVGQVSGRVLAGENGRPGLVPAVPIMFFVNTEVMELGR